MRFSFPSLSRFSGETVQLTIALILALAAFAVFGYWALSLVDRNDPIDVVVAKRDLDAPRVLTADDVEQARIRRDVVPSLAIARVADAVGLTLVQPIAAKQFVTTKELAGALDPKLAGLKIPIGQHGFVLPVAWLSGPPPSVASGDYVTILVSGKASAGAALNTGIIAKAVLVESVQSANGIVQDLFLPLDVSIVAQIVQAHVDQFALTVLVDGRRDDGVEDNGN